MPNDKAAVAAWTKTLPPDAHEIRVNAGPTKTQVSSIGTVHLADPGNPADAIVQLVNDADVGDYFRCHVFAQKGSKSLTTKLFSPTTANGKANGRPGANLSEVPKTVEGALWGTHLILGDVIHNLTSTLVQTVEASAAPVSASAELFRSESGRREALEERVRDLVDEQLELMQVASEASNELARREQDDNAAANDELRGAAAEAVRAVLDKLKGEPEKPAEK